MTHIICVTYGFKKNIPLSRQKILIGLPSMGEFDLKVVGETTSGQNSGEIIGTTTIPMAKLTVTNLRVTSRKVSEIQISWVAPFGEIVKYEVIAKAANFEARVEQTSDEMFTFRYLEPDTKVGFVIVIKI